MFPSVVTPLSLTCDYVPFDLLGHLSTSFRLSSGLCFPADAPPERTIEIVVQPKNLSKKARQMLVGESLRCNVVVRALFFVSCFRRLWCVPPP